MFAAVFVLGGNIDQLERLHRPTFHPPISRLVLLLFPFRMTSSTIKNNYVSNMFSEKIMMYQKISPPQYFPLPEDDIQVTPP